MASATITYPSDLESENVNSIIRIRGFDYTAPFNQSAGAAGMTPVTSVDPNEAKIDIKIASPMQIQSNYNFSYQEEGRSTAQMLADVTTLTGGLQGTANAFARLGRSALASTLPFLGRELELEQGTALNPMTVLMFNGPTHREFALNFMMKPKSEKDARNMQNIIYAFKSGGHPSVSGTKEEQMAEIPETAVTPLFFHYPDYWVLDFMQKNEGDSEWKPQPYIYTTQRCFIQSISVNYHNAGTQSYFKKDGLPTAVALAIQFKEFNVITREHIQTKEGIVRTTN